MDDPARTTHGKIGSLVWLIAPCDVDVTTKFLPASVETHARRGSLDLWYLELRLRSHRPTRGAGHGHL